MRHTVRRRHSVLRCQGDAIHQRLSRTAGRCIRRPTSFRRLQVEPSDENSAAIERIVTRNADLSWYVGVMGKPPECRHPKSVSKTHVEREWLIKCASSRLLSTFLCPGYSRRMWESLASGTCFGKGYPVKRALFEGKGNRIGTTRHAYAGGCHAAVATR